MTYKFSSINLCYINISSKNFRACYIHNIKLTNILQCDAIYMILLCTLEHNKLQLSYVVNNIELYIGIFIRNMPIGDSKTFIGERYGIRSM